MSNEHLVREFLDAVADLEKVLGRRSARDAQGLGDAVRQLSRSDSLVHRYFSELMAFVGLRNAIVHNSYHGGLPIATPNPETVARAKAVLAQFERPVFAFELGHQPVMFAESDALRPSLQKMAAQKLSQARSPRTARTAAC